MPICGGCEKRIWFWQRRVKQILHFEDGQEEVFHTHLNENCCNLLGKKKLFGYPLGSCIVSKNEHEGNKK